jgi:plasmid stabilization system protein ParE
MKKYNVCLMPDAIKDLEDIYDYIAEQSGFRERAWSYIEKLKRKCQELEALPQPTRNRG